MKSIVSQIYATRWIHTVFLVLLVFFTVLKENQSFYRTSGGWPIWMRQLITYGYYPIFAIMFIWFVAMSVDGAAAALHQEHPESWISLGGWMLINIAAFLGMTAYIICQ